MLVPMMWHRAWSSAWRSGLVVVLLGSGAAHADEPVILRQTWGGHVGFFATGAPLAVDGPDGDTTNADMLAQPADVAVGPPDVSAMGQVRAAYLYWGGSIVDSECSNPAAIDDTVSFTPPGGPTTDVVGEACFCSDAAAGSYDVQACRADVTALVSTLVGTYSVDGFAADITNSSTSNASFSIVLVFDQPGLPPRRVALYDGLLTMSSAIDPEEILTLDGLDIDSPPVGDLTWYVIEGDVGGGAGESVEVTGIPGGGTLLLGDAYNPLDNPMNHTITTTMPPQTDLIGVDVDRFELDAALAPTDTAIEVRYTAGMDKWWLVYDVVGVNVYEPVLYDESEKSWVLHDDGDGDGVPSPGDVIRYTLHLSNTGNADGTVTLSDPIPSQAASWTLVDAGGGVDASVGDTASVIDLALEEGANANVVIDVVLDDVPDGTVVSNTAEYTAEPGGVHGYLVAPLVVVSNVRTGSSSGEDPGDGTTGGSTGGDTSVGTGAVDETGMPASTGAAGSGGGTSAVSSGETSTLPGTSDGSDPDDGGTTVLLGDEADPGGCGCREHAPRGAGTGWIGAFAMVVLLRRRRVAASS